MRLIFVLFFFFFQCNRWGILPHPSNLSLSLLNFFSCVLIVFFNNLSFSLGRRSVPFTCLLGNESTTVTNGLIYNYSKQSQKFSLREFSCSIKNSVLFSNMPKSRLKHFMNKHNRWRFFFRSVQGTLQRGARASIALPFGAAEAQRMNWARVSDLFHLLVILTIKCSIRNRSSFSVTARRK